ncbi:D-inositol-3-phosphate glycosyltransferase [wastewater metagenome]|uniref:D-inositol-3-phosphate glycosyltransferase n=2 Tax=unclassified sequences TaxID=12908 RepID=A0A5B8RGC6_9ZZZZ|nr:glycosyltransferase [Arhodomonas sp. KWT]QEA07691.1 D-inositol-3-phosphate glycosyltransferase [uncultured organism]
MTVNATIGVLHTIDTTGPGGAETVFRQLATGLDPARFRSVVAITGEGWLADDLRAHGVTPVMLPGGRRRMSVRYLRALVGLIRRERIDVVQAHLFGTAVYASIAGLLTRRPVVATLHGSVDVDPADRVLALKFALLRAGLSAAVFVSDALRDGLAAGGVLPAGRCRRIYNGVDVARYRGIDRASARERLGAGDGEILLGALGNIRPAKDYGVLLEAMARLVDGPQGHRFRLVIAGQPDRHGLHEALLRRRDELGLGERVAFTGHCTDVPGLLGALDAFVLSSASEGLSIATLEAMAAGVPVVATRCGGPEEIVSHGETGWLVPAGDPAALATGLARVAGDPDLSARLAASGLARVRAEFSLEAMTGAYAGVYEQALARNGSCAPAPGWLP